MVVTQPAFGRRGALHADDPSGLDEQPVVGSKAHRRGIGLAPRRRADEVEQVAVHGDAPGGGGRVSGRGREAARWHANRVYTIA